MYLFTYCNIDVIFNSLKISHKHFMTLIAWNFSGSTNRLDVVLMKMSETYSTCIKFFYEMTMLKCFEDNKPQVLKFACTTTFLAEQKQSSNKTGNINI